MTRRPQPGPDLFDLAEEDAREAKQRETPPCLYNSPARGLAARIAEHAAYVAEWGNWGSGGRSHAWSPTGVTKTAPAEVCRESMLSVDTRRQDPRWDASKQTQPDCSCVADYDDLLYRGACRNPACDWEGPARADENVAAVDAVTHAHPAWLTLALPIVATRPYSDDKKRVARHWEQITEAYPAGWLEGGGPILTWREAGGTRHVENATPWGGYDLSVELPGSRIKWQAHIAQWRARCAEQERTTG